MSRTEPIPTDALVIGGGPTGLFQVFQLGLLEMHAHLIDALPHLGGQCAELYPDKPIYDVPGIPVCSGRELVDRLVRQMAPMKPDLHLGRTVVSLAVQADGRIAVEADDGRCWLARSVFIAGGVGAFEPKRLKLDGIEVHEGRQLHHHLPEPDLLAGRDVLILGGEEPAVETALALSDRLGSTQAPARIALLHRRDVLKAEPAALAEFSQRCRDGRLQFIVGQPVGHESTGERLKALVVSQPDASTRVLDVDQVLVRQGLSPRLGPIADWGLAMERKQLVVEPLGFQTSLPGVHAVGDVVTYPGKKKLILCGFHEATMAAHAAAGRLFPDRPQHLLYTTTSPKLHRILGVGTA